MFRKLLAIFSVFVLAFIAGIHVASADACNDSSADWNQDKNSGSFSCVAMTPKQMEAARLDHTFITSKCDIGQYCIRRADCVSALGGKCYNEKKDAIPNNWERVRFHCPGENEFTCWRPIQPVTPPPDTTTPNLPPTTTNPPPVVNVSDCCRRIVPDPGTNPNNGLPYEYTLNHVVQTAINVYECILCIVGALILAMLITGAIMMMISAGNPALVNKGKQIIAAAIVGGIIVFASFLIVNFVVKAVGANFVDANRVKINPTGPSN